MEKLRVGIVDMVLLVRGEGNIDRNKYLKTVAVSDINLRKMGYFQVDYYILMITKIFSANLDILFVVYQIATHLRLR